MNRESFRQTGRTTRMIRQIEAACHAGNYCFVVCATTKQCAELADLFARMTEGRRVNGPKVYVGEGSATFEIPMYFDWDSRRFPNAHPSCLVYIDHYVLEQKMGWVLDEWLSLNEDALNAEEEGK